MRRTQMMAAALLLTAAPLAAQDDLPGRPLEPEEPLCPCEWAPDSAFHSFAERMPRMRVIMLGRAQLGVLLGATTEVGGRTGVRVEEVRAGGPAERAGLRNGDILLSIDGRPLGENPVQEIRRLLADTEPGDTVDVTFSREGREQTVAAEVSQVDGLRIFGRGPAAEHLPMRMPHLRMAAGMPGQGLSLVAMNEGLGEYFGVSEGVLVAAVPERSSLALQAGDIIVAIDGRAVRDPAHAHSILHSYRPDEPISLDVVRDGERMTVTGTRPDARGRRPGMRRPDRPMGGGRSG